MAEEAALYLVEEWGFSEAAAALTVQMAATFAVSTVAARVFAPDVPQTKDNGVREQTPPDTTTGIPMVYGDAYLGGKFVDACTSANQHIMYYVMAISCTSDDIQSYIDTNDMYYGDRKITFHSENQTEVVSLTDTAGNVDTTIAGNNLNICLYRAYDDGTIQGLNTSVMPWENHPDVMHNGIPSGVNYIDTVDTVADLPISATTNDGYIVRQTTTRTNALYVWDGSLFVETPYDEYRVLPDQAWASTGRRMNNLIFAVIRLNYNQGAGTTQLQPITFKVSNYLNESGEASPGDVWYDYMTNPIYGCAVDSNFVDADSKNALNTYSRQLITYTNSSGNPATMKRYQFNGVLDTGATALSNVDKIVTSCDSWMQYNAASGKWAIVINKAETTAMAFDDSNIIGDITVGATDITSSINQIEAKFPDHTNRDQWNYVNIQTPSELLYPNEPVNKYTITYDMINDSVRAQYLANRILEQNREDLTVSFSTSYNGIQCTAGDVISVTNSAYGWNQKLFRVMQVKEVSLPDGNLGASLQLIEYNAQVYDDQDITEYQPAPNGDLASSGFFSELSAPTISDQLPNAAFPSFSVDCLIPYTGRVNSVKLFFTTSATPLSTDWQLLGNQTLPSSTSYANGSTLKFSSISLPTGTYYFAYKVANDTSESALSPSSTSYAWSPNPTSTNVSGTFVATFSPPVLQVPYVSGAPVLTGIQPQLYGTAAGGAIDYVDAGTDADTLFVNNSWRIGASSTTGLADIVKSNITIGNPTDGGNFALFPVPSAMSGNPATISVPVRYKNNLGVVSQGATAICQLAFSYQGAQGPAGDSGNKVATISLYQWATTTPSNPAGTSTYTWATTTNASYTGGNGWTTTIPANPATPNIKLYTASKSITDVATAVSTSVSWTSGYTVQAVSQNGANGANGLQSANAIVYQWAVTIPSPPSGTSTYTWSSNTFTPTPAGWSLTGGTAPSAGYTLWAARVNLVDSATVTTSSINWTTATIAAVGYAGTNGSTGTTGASSRICYTKTTLSSLASTPTTITTSGSSSFPPANSWGTGTSWQATPPTIVAGESVYQSDGIYDPSTGNTVWNVPYLSALKVGSLSAITANMGTLTAGTIQNSAGTITLNLNATGTDTVFGIGTSTLIDASGNAVFKGNLTGIASLTAGTINTGTGSTLSMGTDGNGSVFRVNRNKASLLPPIYAIDYAVNSSEATEWINTYGYPISTTLRTICDVATTEQTVLSGLYTMDSYQLNIGDRVLVKDQATPTNIKTACAVATVGNITLSGLQTIDGVSVVAGNRVLVKNQTPPNLKTNCRVATTESLFALNGLLTIDGITLVANDRVLVKNQTNSAQNGIYIASATAWTRATDADTWAEIYNAFIPITTGTLNANTNWVTTSSSSGTLDVNNITFAKWSQNSTNAPTNGIYIVASGAWTRATDADLYAELFQAWVTVTSGTVYGGTIWYFSTENTGTINTTNIPLLQSFVGYPTASQNGIYVAASGAWSRASDSAAFADYYNTFVYNKNGVLNGTSGFYCTAPSSGTLGTTSINYIPIVNNIFRNPCRLATTANLASLSGLLTIDGVVTVAGDRILVKDQTTTSQNGVYIVASGAWARATDFDVYTEFYRTEVYITSGSTNIGKYYVSATPYGGVIDTNAITFAQNIFEGNSTQWQGQNLYLTANGGNAIYAADLAIASDERIIGIYGARQNSQLEVIAYGSGHSQHSTRIMHNTQISGGVVNSSAIIATEGGNAFYAETGGYGPFTGTHDGLISKTAIADVGDILVDDLLIAKKDVSNTIYSVLPSSQPNTPSCGIFVNTEDLIVNDPPTALIENIYTETIKNPNGIDSSKTIIVPNPQTPQLAKDYYLVNMNAVGEGQVNVCGENGDIQAGDLIVTSSMAGKGMKQSDNIVRSITVAKARESVTFDSPNDVKMIACIYLCG